MAVNLSPVGGVAAQFFSNNGVPLAGGKIFTYSAGTTTPAATYTSSNGATAWTNPVVLDAAGRVPGSGEIWLTDGINYKFVLKDSNDVLIATYDNISGINSNFVAYTNNQEIQTATAGQTVFTLTTMAYQPATNSLSVFVDGVNQYGPGAQYSYVETDSTTVTFNAGLHVGAEVKFTTTQQQGAGAVDASQVTYDPPFTGGVATNVEAKLAQYVSVKDFGAVGDGVTDDTVAIQAALNTHKSVYFPAGEYLAGELDVTQTGVVPGQGNGIRHIDFNGATLKVKAASTFGIRIRNSDFVRLSNMRLDMNNVANCVGVAHSGGWHCYIEHIQSVLANVDDTSYDLYINGGTTYPSGGGALWGAYTSEYHNLFLKRVNIAGDPVGGYVTTLNFFNMAVQSGTGVGAPGYGVSIANAGAINFYSPILQGCASAFYLSNVNQLKIYTSYVEGCGYYLNCASAVSNVLSVGGQNSLTIAYLNGSITGQYWLDDNPTGQQRLQYTGDQLRGRLGYVEQYVVQDKTLNQTSSQYICVEPGGWNNTAGLVAHQYVVQSASPLKGQYDVLMNRGDQAVRATRLIFDSGSGKAFLGLGANSSNPTASFDADGYNIRIRDDNTPASSSAAGSKGEIRWDSGYIYVCVATNTWKRATLNTF